MARNFKVVLVSSSGLLTETVQASEDGDEIDIKRHKTKKLKDDYKSRLKDPSRFKDSHMADSNHPTIVMRRGDGDNIIFYCSEPFVLFTTRDPEIDEDFSGPDSPFVDSDDAPLTFNVSRANPEGGPAGREFLSGPYTVADDAHRQRFYKFSAVTNSGKVLDPDLVTDP